MFEKTALVEQAHRTFHLARTFTYLGEYKLLHEFTKLFRPWVEVPEKHHDQSMRPLLIKDIDQLFADDSKLFSSGLLPLTSLAPESPLTHAKRLSQILVTAVKMSRQRKVGKLKPDTTPEGVPEYFARNFHWQIDGYLSTDSADIYDHQVEILFTGTARAMRRLALSPIAEYLKKLNHRAQILEVAAGTGELSEYVAMAFPAHNLTVTDLSAPYLQKARARLSNRIVNFTQASAEDLPFKDASQDVIYSVFLFHELPTEIREKAMSEAFRVLKPGGLLVIVDSIQDSEVPEYQWALDKFPIDYHEPFYKGYLNWPLKDAFVRHGFTQIETKRGFFSKCVWAIKPS